MIMEYAEGGELFNYIIDQGCLSEDESRSIFQQIIDAIYYLHQIGICHRDLKPENILFDSKDKKKIKIIDFGLSNLYIAGDISNNNTFNFGNKKDLLITPCGSSGYAPPEMILGCKYDGIMTDIWSSGIILYAMLCGCLPFDDFSEDKLYSKIIKGNYEYPPMIDISEEAKNFINSILVVDPKQRANIDDIKHNKWFRKNYNPSMGLFISICEIPVSNLILKEMEKRGYDRKKIIDCIKNNNHNSLTTIYYLLVKKKIKQGIQTESDMISNKCQEFIKEQNLKIKKENIKPISLKMFILNTKKHFHKNKENNNNHEKEIKNENIKKNGDRDDVENNNKENINKNNETKEKNIINDNKENNNKENNYKKYENKRKNKTISKEKNHNINNIKIKNIKNIHFININNIKTKILMKTCDMDNNKIKLYKKITEITNNKKEGSSSNSKNKGNKNKINITKMKEGQFRNYINLQIQKNSIISKAKKLKNEKIKLIKNNRTMLGDLNQINKDFNLTLNNNDNYNSIAIDNNSIKKGIFLSNNINNNNNYDKNLINCKIKLNKSKKIKVNLGLKQFIFNPNKNKELNKYKKNINNSRRISSNDKNKINNIKISSITRIGNLLNDLKTSRFANKRFIINSISSSQSKSKSNQTRRTQSNSSNSKTKSNSIRDRINNEKFFAFKSSRNNNSKMKSGDKNKEKIYTNLTHERLSNLRSIKYSNNSIGKEISLLQNKNNDLNINIIKTRISKKYSTNSKSNKKNISKQINNNLQNFKTSKENHTKKRIKLNNNMNIKINDKKRNNNIQMNNTNIIEKRIIKDQKKYPSLNLGMSINSNKNKDTLKKLKNKKDESFNLSNINQKLKKFETNNQQKNNKKIGNTIQNKNNIKEKSMFQKINDDYNKIKEYNKYSSSLKNATNNPEDYSQEYNIDLSNLRLYSKKKISKIINNSKIRNNKNNIKKRIKIGEIKSFQMKNIPIFQDLKPQTYRKDKKNFDEIIFSNDSKIKEKNISNQLVNYLKNSINSVTNKKK